MKAFRNVENMKLCISIFEKYMHDKFNVDINKFTETNVKIELYNIMNDICTDESFKELDLKNQNNIVINELKNFYVSKYKLVETKKTNVQNLERESNVFKNRRNIPNMLQPEFTNIKNDDFVNINSTFENLQKERGIKIEKPPAQKLDMLETDKPISEEDFKKQIQNRETLRNEIFTTSVSINPKELFEIKNQNNFDQENRNYVNFSEQKIIEKPTYSLIKSQYLTINGYDRDIASYPNRFKFTVDFNKLSKNYKNVCKISFNNLIIPADVNDSLTSEFGFGLSTPFLMLHIDEFQDVYDGFNEASKKCFTQFVYYKSYRTTNGRGYIILKPCQLENKIFYPSSFSSFQRLSISITKPNGTIFNDSTDTNSILKLEYELFNPMYLKVITNTFFEKNNYYKGDTVIFTNFNIPVIQNGDTTSDVYMEYINNKTNYDKIMEFINRPQGHEIVEIGKPNENGFYRSFYIKNMTFFDQNCGKIVTDKTLLDLISSYNLRDNPIYLPSGSLINMSLQFSLSCQIDVLQSDCGIVHKIQ